MQKTIKLFTIDELPTEVQDKIIERYVDYFDHILEYDLHDRVNLEFKPKLEELGFCNAEFEYDRCSLSFTCDLDMEKLLDCKHKKFILDLINYERIDFELCRFCYSKHYHRVDYSLYEPYLSNCDHLHDLCKSICVRLSNLYNELCDEFYDELDTMCNCHYDNLYDLFVDNEVYFTEDGELID